MKRTRSWSVGCVVWVLLAGAAAPAWANNIKTYDAIKCRANRQRSPLAPNDPDDSDLTRTAAANGQPGRIANNTGGLMRVNCSLPKTTSGPGITNDQIISVTTKIKTGGGFVSCGIQYWQAKINADRPFEEANYVESIWNGASTNDLTLSVGLSDPLSGPSGFWQGNNPPVGWYFAEFVCDLPPGTSIGDYTVTENGNPGSYRIHSMLECSPNSGNTKVWEYRNNYAFISDSFSGGYFYSNGGDAASGVMRFECSLPASSVADFAIGPAVDPSNVNGCNVDNNSLAQMVWRTFSPPLPTEILPRTGEPRIIAPPLGTHKLVCGMRDPGNGDGRLISIRTSPLSPLSRTGWTARASNNSGAAGSALDNNNGSRWDTGTAQVNDQWFEIDMKSSKSVRQVVLDSAGSSSDFPRGYQVFVSNSNTSWGTAVATGSATGPLVEIGFNAVSGRYIRIVKKGGTFSNYWSIHEANVYN